MVTTAAGMILFGRLAVDEPYEFEFVVIGAVLLAAGHLCNWALCRACLRCQGEDGHEAD